MTHRKGASSKNPDPEGPALVHPRGVMCTKRRRKEVMPVFERPYLKRNSTGHRSDQANRYGLEKIGMTGIFRSYGKAYEL
jgi:hypothetical protein